MTVRAADITWSTALTGFLGFAETLRTAVFLTAVFLSGAFTTAFLTDGFLAKAFFAGAFLAGAFFAAAFFVGAFLLPAFLGNAFTLAGALGLAGADTRPLAFALEVAFGLAAVAVFALRPAINVSLRSRQAR
ncbi:MAG TPA: hypothetical protein VIN57_05785 [Magnetovibrio sp.]